MSRYKFIAHYHSIYAPLSPIFLFLWRRQFSSNFHLCHHLHKSNLHPNIRLWLPWRQVFSNITWWRIKTKNQKISRFPEEKSTTWSQRELREGLRKGSCRKESVDLRNVSQLIVGGGGRRAGGGGRELEGEGGGEDHIAHNRPCETSPRRRKLDCSQWSRSRRRAAGRRWPAAITLLCCPVNLGECHKKTNFPWLLIPVLHAHGSLVATSCCLLQLCNFVFLWAF